MRKWKYIGLLIIPFWASPKATSQGFNSDYSKTYINIPMPKTPESQSFEKYGNIPVDEYTGASSISIPLYTVKGRFIEAPILLSYHASGVRVNQEATWVGLGFDLACGGRVTVETRGNVDDYVRYYTTQQGFKDGLRRLFNKWKAPYNPSPNAPSLGYAYLDYGQIYGLSDPIFHSNDTLWDDNFTIKNAAWYGIAEPDIYTASFDGNSIKFYIDLIDESIKFIGEKSLFDISYDRDSSGISKFTIVDNSGKKFYFEQREFTRLSIPTGSYGFNSHINSATGWLLTKIVHPSTDSITFSYANYGETFPAPSWSASITAKIYPYTGVSSYSNGYPPNQIIQTPYFLSQVQSGNTTVNFVLSGREDLRGTGAKKLDKIEVRDRLTNSMVKEVLFSYEYFTANPESYEQSLPDSIKNCYLKRLKLLSVKDFDSPNSKPWQFFYKATASVPSKMSFAQDHWGYYNGVNNTAGHTGVPTYDARRLIPTFQELGNLASRSTEATVFGDGNCPKDNGVTASPGTQINSAFDGLSWGRGCSVSMISAYMMDSVIYPTGGSTKFEFEPHKSAYYAKMIDELIGGGLRIKTLKNYAIDNVLENITSYDYMNSGVYLGAIEYLRVSNKWPSRGTVTMSSNGVLGSGGPAVGYGSVKKTIKNGAGQSNNGYVIKYFNANSALPVQYSNVQYPFQTTSSCEERYAYAPQLGYLSKGKSGIAPMPACNLDGKIYKEEYFNSSAVKVKTTQFYYRQAAFENPFFDLKASDNYDGYAGAVAVSISTCDGAVSQGDLGYGSPIYCPFGWRRWEACLSPAVSFYTVLDSVVEKTLGVNNNYIAVKKAFTYNNYFQQEFSSTVNSDGSQSVSYVRTPLSFENPPVPSNGEGDAYLIKQLRASHIYDLTIEQVNIIRSASGDSLVTGAVYSVYDQASVKKVYALETKVPLVLRTQFSPTYYYHNYPTYPDFYVVKDNRYRIQDSAQYYSTKLIQDLTGIKGRQSFIWDEFYNTIMASTVDAQANDVAHSSFETSAKGNWSYSGAAAIETNPPTGNKSYSLSQGSISKGSLSTNKTYIVSYWSKNGSQNVNGTNATSGRSFNGFTYYEHKVSNPAGGNITVSGTGTIDELRLYPDKAMMTTYTYKPLVGVTSRCDPNNKIGYYAYDDMNRLSLIRDQDNRIVKKMDYKFQICPNTYTHDAQSKIFFKSTCGSGYVSSPVTYTIPAGKYTSCTSQIEIDGLIEADFNANGQAYANDPINGATCNTCYGSYSANTGWTSYYTSFNPNSNTVSLTLVIAATSSSSFDNITSGGAIIGTITSTCCRPTVARSFSCMESGRMWSLTIFPDGQVRLVRTGGAALPSQYQGFTLTGTFNL